MNVCKLSTILNQLSSPDRLERNSAVVALTNMGEAAFPTLPALKKLLDDEPLISIGAAGVIVQIETDHEAAMSVLKSLPSRSKSSRLHPFAHVATFKRHLLELKADSMASPLICFSIWLRFLAAR